MEGGGWAEEGECCHGMRRGVGNRSSCPPGRGERARRRVGAPGFEQNGVLISSRPGCGCNGLQQLRNPACHARPVLMSVRAHLPLLCALEIPQALDERRDLRRQVLRQLSDLRPGTAWQRGSTGRSSVTALLSGEPAFAHHHEGLHASRRGLLNCGPPEGGWRAQPSSQAAGRQVRAPQP